MTIDFEYAVLAADVYSGNDVDDPDRLYRTLGSSWTMLEWNVGENPLPSEIVCEGPISTNEPYNFNGYRFEVGGFSASAYRNDNGEIVIAYEGTDFSNWNDYQDWSANIQSVFTASN